MILISVTRTIRSAAALVAMIVCLTSVAFGITLEEYHSKVEAARTSALASETALRKSDDFAPTAALIRQIRKDFPLSERVDWRGGTVEVSNDWLLDRIGELEKDKDSKKRLVDVVTIREYLSSVAFKLQALEQPAPASRSKDEDRQKLAEILRREEYQKPERSEESLFQRWLREFLEWLESWFPKPTTQEPSSSGFEFLAGILQVVLFVVLLGLLGFLAYKIAPALFPKLRRFKKARRKDRMILGEQIGEDIAASDLFNEAERLAREGNLRGAIRKGYIALLCDLSDRKVIGLARNKTNRDYLRDVRSRGDLLPRMKEVTDMFERHWYGFQASNEDDWRRFRDRYQEAIRSV